GVGVRLLGGARPRRLLGARHLPAATDRLAEADLPEAVRHRDQLPAAEPGPGLDHQPQPGAAAAAGGAGLAAAQRRGAAAPDGAGPPPTRRAGVTPAPAAPGRRARLAAPGH